MNYTIKMHAQFIEKMYNELRKSLPSENTNPAELREFLVNLKKLTKYTATVHEMAKTEEN